MTLFPGLRQVLRTASLAVGLAGVSACLISIDDPKEGSTLTVQSANDPVKVAISGNASYSGLTVKVDGTDFSNQMTSVPGQHKDEGNLSVGVGSHTLVASASVYCWYCSGTQNQSTQTRNFTVTVATTPIPALTLGPAGLQVTVGAPAKTADVRVSPAQTGALTVNLSDPNGKLTVSSSVQIPANSTNPVGFSVSGISAGTANLTASATGASTGNLSVPVAAAVPPPVVSALCPNNGMAGTPLRISGTGFTGTVTVAFGGGAPVAVTPTSSTQINTTIPNALAAGATTITVASNGVSAAPQTFTITAGPLLLRAINDRVELIRFVPGTGFQLAGFANATLSPGNLSVGLTRSCDRAARASASDAQLFAIGGTAAAPSLTLVRGTPLPTTLTGNGTSAGFVPTLLVRGTDMGVETIDSAGTPMARRGGVNGAGSSIGVSIVTLAGPPPLVFRSHASGIDVYNVSTPTAPVQVTNLINGMSASTTGSALAWVTPGSRLVRASSGAIEVIDVSGTALTRQGANITGGGSSQGVAVAVSGSRAVRGTSTGIEVYDISNPASPQRCAFRNAAGSSTGVGVAVVGTLAFRATNSAIEAYDISNTTCPTPASGTIIPAPVTLTTGLGLSSTGVALVGP
jgi:hypothetical protein